MNWVDILFGASSLIFVLLFLYGGVFFFLAMERFFLARVEHRDGPGRHGSSDYLQVWKDFRKSRIKVSGQAEPSFYNRIAVLIWKLLPALFLITLFTDFFSPSFESSKLMIVLFFPILSIGLEAMFLHASSHQREKRDWKKRIQLRLLGATLLSFSFFTATLQIGSPSVAEISRMQASFPFLLLFFSPGLFLCCLASLGGIFLFLVEDPIQNESELSLGRSLHYPIFFVKRMWIFCLLSLWVLVFFGGIENIISKVLFPLKLAIFLLMFILLQVSFPKVRNSDAGELAIRWLLPLCLMSFLVEALWVGLSL
jgi:NADH:ubiquinone oxidoreductase subunit H